MTTDWTVTAEWLEQDPPDTRIGVPFLLTHGEHDGTGNIRKDGPRWAARPRSSA